MTDWAYDGENSNRLSTLNAPVLLTNSQQLLLQQKALNVELHVYPNLGHGHLWQDTDVYVKRLGLFLRGQLEVGLDSFVMSNVC